MKPAEGKSASRHPCSNFHPMRGAVTVVGQRAQEPAVPACQAQEKQVSE